MDELKVFVDLKPLTDEEIKSKNFGLSDLWMVKIDGKDPYGPYDTESLKDYAQKYQFLFEKAKVYNLEKDEWYDMFAVAAFQRRKPQLVSAQNLIQTQSFYILYNGQKDGPHSQEKIQALLDKELILPSTQVSLDNGQSWIKLYEHHAFDRRTKKSNQELPFRPNEEVLEKVKTTKEQILKIKEAEDAIVQFAHIGHADTANIDYDVEIELEEKKQKQNLKNHAQALSDLEIAAIKKLRKSKRLKVDNSKASTGSSWWKYASAFVVVLAVAGYGFYSTYLTPKFAPTAVISKESPEQNNVNTNAIDNSERQIINKPIRKPASLQNNQPKIIQKPRRTVSKPRPVMRQPKRYVRKKTNIKQIFEKDIENIDINDPEVQDELTRQLAGDYDDQEEERPQDDRVEDEREDDYPRDEEVRENPYRDEEENMDEPYADDRQDQENY